MIFSGAGAQRKEVKQASPAAAVSEEERLEKILSDIKGAGDVSVMISYYSSGEKDIAYEESSRRGSDTEDIDKKAVLSDGEPMVVKEICPKAKGVIVTAEGAADPNVARLLKEAAAAVLDVPVHKVCIYEKTGKERKTE